MKHRSIFHKSILVLEKQLSPQFCSHLINKFEEDKSKHPGVTYGGHNPGIKQSTDLLISFGPHADNWKAEDDELSESLKNAIVKYKEHIETTLKGMFFNDKMFDIGHQMQRTCPGGFYDWHNDASDSRQLTYIWYLNDVKGGDGYTEFCDGTRVYPRAGRMVLFPADWLHVHRGVTPKKELKYIVTGWLYTPLTGHKDVMKYSGLSLPEEHTHEHEQEHASQLDHHQTTEIH